MSFKSLFQPFFTESDADLVNDFSGAYSDCVYFCFVSLISFAEFGQIAVQPV